MKNFDEVRELRLAEDRRFKIGGVEFTARASVPPEVIAAWEDSTTDSAAKSLEVIDKVILELIEDGQEDQWRAVRSREVELPISMQDLTDVVQWLVERHTRRPTVKPSGSSPSDGGSGSSSTGASHLQAVEG